MVGPLESSAHGHTNTMCELGGKGQCKLTCILLVSPLLMCMLHCTMGGTLLKKHKCKNEILENFMMAIAEFFEGKALHRLYA